MEPGLAAEHDFEFYDSTYPFGAHVSVVGSGRRTRAPNGYVE